MVSRKILIALGVFAVLAIGIGSVCAVQNIEVDGMKFRIPDEYKEDTSLATEGVTNEDGFKIYNRTYFDSSNKMIHISVFHGNDTDKLSLDDLKEPTDVKKTIKGYDGLLDHDKDAGLYFFTYRGWDTNSLIFNFFLLIFPLILYTMKYNLLL